MKKKINVGITGQGGFIGSHLYNFLCTKQAEVQIIDFNRSFFKNSIVLQAFVESCDVIVHMAAINRHKNNNFIYKTNIDLVKKLTSACDKTNSKPKIIFASSTQENENNPYGKSKLDARRYLESWAKKNKVSLTSLIIPNVFGPFGKPFYNSFIATFSYQIINGKKPKVINDRLVDLIYVNELCIIYYNEIIYKINNKIKTQLVKKTSSKKVSNILSLLYEFKLIYFDKGQIPNIKLNSFELYLFNTFRSFIPKEYFPRFFKKNTDNRGSFVEIIRADTAGQSSYSTTASGITRGNHYHTRKIERFAVISGKASIKLRKIDSDEVIEYKLSGKKPGYVDMPIWYTHNITNIGKDELITLFWINEPYNDIDSDTYFVNV